jgi:hypothetical protein
MAEQTPDEKARTEARRAVRAAVAAMARAAGVHTEPHSVWPGHAMTEQRPDASNGLRFALMLDAAATNLAREYVRFGRQEGLSWQQLGEIIAPAMGGADEGDDLAVLAFMWAANAEHAQPFADLYVTWTCPACLASVRDHGPYEADPRNAEAGHDDGCARLAEAVAAYDAEWGDE